MQTKTISDRQLAYRFLKNIPWLTLFISITSVIVYFLTENTGHDSAFALKLKKDTLNSGLMFDANRPLNLFGLTAFSSFFLHSNSEHLFSNLFWLNIVGVIAERKDRLKFLIALGIGHLSALTGGIIAHRYYAASADMAGMSGGIVALALYWLVNTQAKISALVFSGLFAVLMYLQGPAFTVSHGLPALSGVCLALIERKLKSPASFTPVSAK